MSFERIRLCCCVLTVACLTAPWWVAVHYSMADWIAFYALAGLLLWLCLLLTAGNDDDSES